MHEIAFYIGSKGIHWYGVCISLGFLAALMLLLWKRKHVGMNSEEIVDLSMLALFSGIAGARIFYVAEFWNQSFAGRPFWKIFRIDEGGLVFYGGFLCAFTSLWIYARWKKLSIRRILDIFAPAMALAHAFGRIGCFLQGCCFGRPWTGGVVFPAGSLPAMRYPDVHTGTSLPLYPVQLYESGLNILLCVLLLLLFSRCRKGGQIAAIYLMGYAFLRFSLEFFRGDHVDSIAGLTPSQTISLLLMVPMGALLFWYWSRKSDLPPPGGEVEDSPARKQLAEKEMGKKKEKTEGNRNGV